MNTQQRFPSFLPTGKAYGVKAISSFYASALGHHFPYYESALSLYASGVRVITATGIHRKEGSV